MSLLCHNVDMVVVELTLQDFAEVKFLKLVSVLAVLLAKQLDIRHWLPWTPGVILTNVTVSCARNKRLRVSPAQVSDACVPDWNLQIEFIVWEVFGCPKWLVSCFVDVPDLEKLLV